MRSLGLRKVSGSPVGAHASSGREQRGLAGSCSSRSFGSKAAKSSVASFRPSRTYSARVFALAEKPEGGAQGGAEESSENMSIFGVEKTAESTFQLKFVWGSDTLAFAVDQVLGRGNSSPLTEYFFWPQDDAWENLKAVLESKDWIPASQKIAMLNRVTEVINFWTPQEGQEQNSTDQAKAKFSDCQFVGTFY